MNSRKTPQKYASPQPHQKTFNDNFFGDFDFSNFERFEDPFERMFQSMNIPRLGFGIPSIFNIGNQASNNRNQLASPSENNQNDFSGQLMGMRGTGPGTFLCKSYVSRVNYKDGKPEKEVYQSQAINHFGQDGHKIQERQEAYKNAGTGVEKAAKQRMFDDRGHKYIKERNAITKEQSEHNVFKGMDENQLGEFDAKFNDYKKQVNFDNNYQLLNRLNNNQARQMIGQGQVQGQTNSNNYNGYNQRASLPQQARIGNDDIYNRNNNYNGSGNGNKGYKTPYALPSH